MRESLRWWVLLLALGAIVLLLLLAVPGCSTRPSTDQEEFLGAVEADGSASFTMRGVSFEATPDARMRMDMTLGSDQPRTTLLFCRDRLLEVQTKELTIGGRSYGIVQPGQSVRLDAEGVHVDEELRGALPE